MRNKSGNVKGNIPGKQEGESKSVISRQNLIEEQSNDKELLDLFKIALTPVEAEKVCVGYLIKDNILMRKWSPTECYNGEKGNNSVPNCGTHSTQTRSLRIDTGLANVWSFGDK